MSATILSKAGVTLLFGIDAGIAAITGFIANDADFDYEAKMAEAYDSNGSTTAVAFFDQTIDLKVNALLISGTTLPLPGSTITLTSGSLIGSIEMAVIKVSGKEKNNGFTFVTIDLKRWTDNAIPN